MRRSRKKASWWFHIDWQWVVKVETPRRNVTVLVTVWGCPQLGISASGNYCKIMLVCSRELGTIFLSSPPARWVFFILLFLFFFPHRLLPCHLVASGRRLDPNIECHRCQKDCQIECQNIFQLECQKECQNRNAIRTFRWYVTNM